MSKPADHIRRDFIAYWLDLQAEARRDGAIVNRASEWETFLEAHRDEGTGELPDVKMPRSNRA